MHILTNISSYMVAPLIAVKTISPLAIYIACNLVYTPVTEYLDPHDIWTPGPKYYEIFGPPLKCFIPHEARA